MKTIEPTYVSFEQAKLLKEKGFDQRSELYRYNSKGELSLLEGINAPEQWQVVEFLRVNHDIWIQVSISKYGVFYCNILQNQPTKSIDIPMTYEMICQLNDFNSPQKAYSSAFDYVLKELI
jgi:hypothetical protein